MNFCKECQNQLYISVNGDNLVHKCNNCNYEQVEDYSTSARLIASNTLSEDTSGYTRYMTKYIKYDPTLPRVKNIVCVNESCNKPHDTDNEVIYIKYDYKNLKYLYFCCHCEHFWRRTGEM